MAGACMGTGAFIFASNFSDYGIIGTGILAPGPFIMCLATRTYKEISYKRRSGSWFKPGNASRVMTPEGKILWKSLIPVTVNLLTNGGYLVVMSLGWKFAKASNMNQGIISTLLSMASLFNIIVFYFKFGEKISCLHFIGVALMIACVLFISLAATSKTEEDLDFDDEETMGLS